MQAGLIDRDGKFHHDLRSASQVQRSASQFGSIDTKDYPGFRYGIGSKVLNAADNKVCCLTLIRTLHCSDIRYRQIGSLCVSDLNALKPDARA